MKNLNEKELYTLIDKILWEQWDPIGINVDNNARNEYHGYIPLIFQKVLQNKSENEIANSLYEIEKNRMGLDGNYENCLRVAKSILLLHTKK